MELSLPAGTPRGLPNCGVVAVAVAAGVPYRTALHAFKGLGRRYYKQRAWLGRTYHADRMAVLYSLGVEFTPQRVEGYPTLLRWVRECTLPGHTYMVLTTEHVQVVRDGMVIDQTGNAPVEKFHWRRKRVNRATLIHSGSAPDLGHSLTKGQKIVGPSGPRACA